MKLHPNLVKPVILIGPVCDDPTESVSSVNKALLDGLKDQYDFVAPSSNRQHGTTKQARFNAWNLIYLVRHTLTWVWALIRHRPRVAHYGLTTAWALEKGLFLLLLARIFGAKTVGHIHAGDFGEYIDGLSGLRRRWILKQLQMLDAFIVLSEYWRGVVAVCAGIPRERLFVVSNPISADFEQAALQIPVQRPGNTILSLGTMCRDKGVLDILDAVALLRPQTSNFRVILAGPEREPGILEVVKRQIASDLIAEQICLNPGLWGDAKVAMFREAPILLLPSYIENFPLVVLEAAAAGQAIITTAVGAVPEFFEDGVSALFVEPGNPKQIADAILRLLNNPEERFRLATAARETFKSKLGRREIMDSLDAVYLYVLGGEVSEMPDTTVNCFGADSSLGGSPSDEAVCGIH